MCSVLITIGILLVYFNIVQKVGLKYCALWFMGENVKILRK